MKTRLRLWAGALLFFLALGSSQAGAGAAQPLTLAEALQTALEHNTSYALFLWEQELAQRREILKKHPEVEAAVQPGQLQDGQWLGSGGAVTIKVPLGRHLDLAGALGVSLDGQGLEVQPSGSLSLQYDFFALPPDEAPLLSAEEALQREINGLVLQVVDLLMGLRQAMDRRDYAQAVLGHIQAKLAAAQKTPGFDDLELRRELRSQMAAVAALEEEVIQLQPQLGTVLGLTGRAVHKPLLEVQVLAGELGEQEIQAEVFAASVELRSARKALEQAQAKLDMERKTGGWKLRAIGSVSLGQLPGERGGAQKQEDPSLSWNLGLTASKTLYPQKIVLEELELAVAKAEHELAVQESTLLGALRGRVQAIRSAQNLVESQGELLRAAEEDLELRQRQYAAGLVTELQVEEARLALEKAQMEYFHQQLAYARSVLDLWALCGRRLQDAVYEVVR
ncbi:MAG TPA: TolC family protein [Limnochordia bacterium]|nr:TolC family protein [Limnochordia bacterium]